MALGDSAAFWELWQYYRDYLFAICFQLMGERHADAEDALSRAMQKARDFLLDGEPKIRNLKAWLAQLVRHQCIDMHRELRSRGGRTISIDELFENRAVLTDTASPRNPFALRELVASVEQAVERLPPRLRAPSILFFLRERSYRQVAETLGITEENARKRIQQARSILKKKLER